MDRLIVGCQQGTEGLARIPVSTLARRLNPSQTQLGRKFAEAEAMGSLGWSRANLCCGCRRISAGISCCPSGEACDHRCRFRGLCHTRPAHGRRSGAGLTMEQQLSGGQRRICAVPTIFAHDISGYARISSSQRRHFLFRARFCRSIERPPCQSDQSSAMSLSYSSDASTLRDNRDLRLVERGLLPADRGGDVRDVRGSFGE
jgi:hypothetical protein